MSVGDDFHGAEQAAGKTTLEKLYTPCVMGHIHNEEGEPLCPCSCGYCGAVAYLKNLRERLKARTELLRLVLDELDFHSCVGGWRDNKARAIKAELARDA